MNREDRRTFLQKFGMISLAAGTGTLISLSPATAAPANSMNPPGLISLPPSNVFDVLDLDLPELTEVKKALERRGYEAALKRLLAYYREKYPSPLNPKTPPGEKRQSTPERADNLKKHIFQWGPYPPANYGADIDWAADPAGDIEWVAAIQRFNWASDLVQAYLQTGDESYAATFVELTTDWMIKHPLEKTLNKVHPVYKEGVYGKNGWKGYPWLDLQTGIRATNICSSVKQLFHSKAFTPEFLSILLASLYDHQVKTERMPMNKVHNKAIFEQRGFFNVLHTFPEYKDKERWLQGAITITCENIMAQTTTDGVQREWCGGYHSGVYRDVLEIDSRVKDLGYEMPSYYKARVKAMADHIFGISTPDLGFPMFGDTGRSKISSDKRSDWQLYSMLTEASRKFNDPKYKDLAELHTQYLPKNGSTAFPEAGLYAMRNGWSPNDIYMALHCSPPAISSHDTPDNGTFELYANGRWLMPDSGFYTYGHDAAARTWHRQTKIHATLTVNDSDTSMNGRQLHWSSNDSLDILCVENPSYHQFLHRRTVWFVDKNGEVPFFVIADEAIGDLNGEIAVRFPMAPGEINLDNSLNRFYTNYNDSNLLVQVSGKKEIKLKKEAGWHAWSYGKREPRTTIAAIHKGRAPFVFISILVPFKGIKAPECTLHTHPHDLIAGINPMALNLSVGNRNFQLTRTLGE